MKRFAVAYFNFFDNDLKLTIVSAGNWRDALVEAGHIDSAVNDSLPDDYKDAQVEAFNQDWQFAVEEVK